MSTVRSHSKLKRTSGCTSHRQTTSRLWGERRELLLPYPRPYPYPPPLHNPPTHP